MPRLGGEGNDSKPRISLPSRSLAQWSKLRKSRGKSQRQSQTKPAGGSNSRSSSQQRLVNKTWDDMGQTGAKTWTIK